MGTPELMVDGWMAIIKSLVLDEPKREVRPKYLFTLIHGTFARGAAWTKEDSLLCQELKRTLKEEIGFPPFKWTGDNSHSAREIAAQELVLHIEKVAQLHPDADHYLICHSHGGNVVLNMAKITNHHNPPHIAELILLACPVQEKTMHLVSTPMFQRVYSLYSSFDIIQILAPEFKRVYSAHKPHTKRKIRYKLLPFSSRLFPVYSHLTQTKIKINDYPISHTRFSTKEFVALLPTILQKLNTWHQETFAANKIIKHKLLCIYKKPNN